MCTDLSTLVFTCSLIHSLYINSHMCADGFVHLLIDSVISSRNPRLIDQLIASFIISMFVRWLVYSWMHWFIHSFIRSLLHELMRPSMHECVRLFVESFCIQVYNWAVKHVKDVSETPERHHLGHIWEASSGRMDRKHLRVIWKASGKHLENIWKASGRHLGSLGG